ncbi:MAG: class I SAM-dependent methyltransferase, partial [Solirubrobacteraceae bacterium]
MSVEHPITGRELAHNGRLEPGLPGSWTCRLSRRIVLRMLRNLRGGRIELREGARSIVLGELDPARPLQATIEVRSARFYRGLLRGSIGLCESYLAGEWECDDLVSLVRIAALNAGGLDRLRRVLTPVLVPFQRGLRRLARNTPARSRRHIEAHYDLGNELFEEFLDPTMMYSCGVFEHQDASLEEASLAKLRRICRRLELQPTDHVLEIGTGWGGFAIYAAATHGCRVTTTT